MSSKAAMSSSRSRKAYVAKGGCRRDGCLAGPLTGAISALELKGACLEKNWPFDIDRVNDTWLGQHSKCPLAATETGVFGFRRCLGRVCIECGGMCSCCAMPRAAVQCLSAIKSISFLQSESRFANAESVLRPNEFCFNEAVRWEPERVASRAQERPQESPKADRLKDLDGPLTPRSRNAGHLGCGRFTDQNGWFTAWKCCHKAKSKQPLGGHSSFRASVAPRL